MRNYGECSYCSGQVTERQIDLVRQWKGQFVLIENVPAGVCNQCGERYFWGDVSEAMQKLMDTNENRAITRSVEVPVVEFEMA